LKWSSSGTCGEKEKAEKQKEARASVDLIRHTPLPKRLKGILMVRAGPRSMEVPKRHGSSICNSIFGFDASLFFLMDRVHSSFKQRSRLEMGKLKVDAVNRSSAMAHLPPVIRYCG